MTKQQIFDELKAIGKDLITEGGALMNVKRPTEKQLSDGLLLVTVGANLQIIRAELFKIIARRRYRRLRREMR